MFLKKISPHQLSGQEEISLLKIAQSLFSEYDDIRIIRKLVNSENYTTFIQLSLKKKDSILNVYHKDLIHWYEFCSCHVPMRIADLRARYELEAEGNNLDLVRKIAMFMYIKSDNLTTMMRILTEATDKVTKKKLDLIV